MIVYVNGDSYSVVSDGKRYSEFLGESLGCEVVNNAVSGSCNARIIRTSLRDLIELKQQEEKIIAVLSLTFIMRTELWDMQHQVARFRNSNDGDFVSVTPTASKSWFSSKEDYTDKYKEFSKQFLTWYNIEAETVNLVSQLILLKGWCDAHDIRLVIFTGPLQEPIDMTAPFIESLIRELPSNSIIDPFSFSFTEWCTSNGFKAIDDYTQEIHGRVLDIGHHGEAAHKAFAEFLIEKYI
jgi:hypothetical protein